MVHKKSEYRLQFHSLSQDLRKRIWQDNIKFREFRRSVNQAHHYWSYQITDDPCMCDDDIQEKINRYENLAAPVILNSLEKPADLLGDPQESCLSNRKPRSGSVRQVRLKEPEVDESVAQEVAVQTPDWIQEQNVSPEGQSPELHQLMGDLSTSERQEKIQKKAYSLSGSPEIVPEKSPSIEQVDKDSSRIGGPLREPHFSSERPHSSCSPEYLRKRDMPSRFSSLSKTSRKYYFEDKKMPFASYGWNDGDKDIGEKKTYNVNAPETEVHSPALMAQKRRREDIQKYLRKEAQLYAESQRLKSPINLSSIWMSEYQDKYSRGVSPVYGSKFNRPMSAPLYSPLCWKFR